MVFTKETASVAGRKGNSARQEAERRYKAQRQAVSEERAKRPPPPFPNANALVSHAEKKQFLAESVPGKVEIIQRHPNGGGTLLWCSCGNATTAIAAECRDGHLPQRMIWLHPVVARDEPSLPSSKELPELTSDRRLCRKCCRSAARTHCAVCDDELIQKIKVTCGSDTEYEERGSKR